MIIQTIIFDKAAFYMTYGGILTKIEGKYPENTFFVRIPKWLYYLERFLPIVSYRKFGEMRRKIKSQTRKAAGLPAHFTGHNGTGFKFLDIARVA